MFIDYRCHRIHFLIELIPSENIDDIKYTKPERRSIDFCRETDTLLLVKIYGVQLGFFITKRISDYGYKCHFFLAVGIRKFSTIIFREIVSFYSSYIPPNATWYCTARANQKEVRHFIYRHGFRLVDTFGKGSRLYKIKFQHLLAASSSHSFK